MSTSLRVPGIYVEETNHPFPAVEEVESSIPVFIGFTERRISEVEGEIIDEGIITRKVHSLIDFERLCGTVPPTEIAITIKNVREELQLADVVIEFEDPLYTLYYNLILYFANGGESCYIISIGEIGKEADFKELYSAGIEAAAHIDDAAIIVIPEATSIFIHESSATLELYKAALQIASDCRKFVMLDCPGNNPASIIDSPLINLSTLAYGAAYHPFLKTLIPLKFSIKEIKFESIEQEPSYAGSIPVWIQSIIQSKTNELTVTLPPSAAIAGVYVSNDKAKGVWKAPANIELKQVLELVPGEGDFLLENLNDTPPAVNINSIRKFTGKGILVWGARVLDNSNSEFKYVSVRRLFNAVQLSAERYVELYIFKPNNATTWLKIKAGLENYLIYLWRQGALQGSKPEHAFYVAAGLGQTMTEEDLLAGKVIVQIGMAVVRPAEFVVISIDKMMATIVD